MRGRGGLDLALHVNPARPWNREGFTREEGRGGRGVLVAVIGKRCDPRAETRRSIVAEVIFLLLFFTACIRVSLVFVGMAVFVLVVVVVVVVVVVFFFVEKR